YNIGDNLNEGPINSYNTTTPLVWLAYSLDGQVNVTIHGNHTIPFLSLGTHIIQLVGYDYLGNFYQSDLRSFEIYPPFPPIISGPNDFSINYGEPGYYILWTADDPSPSNYTIYHNNTVFREDNWTTTTIIASIDGLEEGKHNFTCVVQNNWGLKASDEVWVTVLPGLPDTTPPIISSPDDISFEEGSLGYTIVWTGSDDKNEWWASVWRDSTLIYDQAWIGNNIEISLEGLGFGIYIFNCTLFDESGNSAFDLVTVTVLEQVPDITAPDITAPAPLQYEEGTEGNELTWICVDDHPHSYLLRINDTDEVYRPWHGGDITINVDGLFVARWILNLTIWDLSGNNASAVVTVTVIPPLPDLTAPLLNQPSDLVIGTSQYGVIRWEASDDHPDSYQILRNGTLIFEGDSWISGLIQFSFQSLPVGGYEFTLIVFDEAGNSASSSVLVKVLPGDAVEEDPPQISHIPDMEFPHPITDQYIIIYLFDAHPAGYSITLSGEVNITESQWSVPNIQINISLAGLAIGEYTLTIIAWDIFENQATMSTQISVMGDIDPPTISSPSDILTRSDVKGTISWEAFDDNPSHYEIISLVTEDNPVEQVLEESTWDGGNIVFTFTDYNLTSGVYLFRCIVYDLAGNIAMDDVAVHITQAQKSPGLSFFEALIILSLLLLIRGVVFPKRRLNK
ncbi:MAG: hypothetical protein ACTSPB_24875, partial [Candidatus Thorarchaeota archaeon]